MTREAKLLDKAKYDQYWARFEAKLRLRESEAKRKEDEARTCGEGTCPATQNS